MPLNNSLVPGTLSETEPGAFGIHRGALDPEVLRKVRRATVLSFLFARQIRQVLDFDDPVQDGNYIRAGVGRVPFGFKPLVEIFDGQFPDSATPEVSILRFRRRKQNVGLEGPHQDDTWDYRFIVPFDDCRLITTPLSARGTLGVDDIVVGDVITLNNSIEHSQRPLHALTPTTQRLDMAVLGRSIEQRGH